MMKKAESTAPMQIFGIDFTSAPSAKKPITCAEALFDGVSLQFQRMTHWDSFAGFESALNSPGPWVAGIDFPFAQARRLVENIGWPETWETYVGLVSKMTRPQFREALEAYKAPRPAGDKHHKRQCDARSKSQSPQTLNYTPVGLMFYEGAPRLLQTSVHLPHLKEGDTTRIVLEAYPGVAARELIGKVPYKNDQLAKQTEAKHTARELMINKLLNGQCESRYGFSLEAPTEVATDPTGDELDALICAIQAAWGWSQRDRNFGAPSEFDRLEGWICDPSLVDRELS